MNFQNFNFDHVEQQHPRTYPTQGPRTPAESQTTASQVTVVHDPLPRPVQEFQEQVSSPSPQPTVIPHAPTPPSNSISEPEFYGPDRLFPSKPAIVYQRAARAHNVRHFQQPSPMIPFDSPNLAMAAMQSMSGVNDFKDELTRAAGTVTPGVDDTPYIQYALETLTRNRYDGTEISSSSEGSYPVHRVVHNPVFRHSEIAPHPPPWGEKGYATISSQPTDPSLLRLSDSRLTTGDMSRLPPLRPDMEAFPFDPLSQQTQTGRPEDAHDMTRISAKKLGRRSGDVGDWIPQPDIDGPRGDDDRAPPLDFKPPILRTPWIATLMISCVLMIIALMLCAIYSLRHNGFVQYALDGSGGPYHGQYFLFRILPQLLASILFLWAQSLISTVFRIMPFSVMASENPQHRRNAGFLPLYPNSFLWPHLIGNWHLQIPIVITWLLAFTIPLQSSLFTVIMVDGRWKWATVQGVAWTLVVFYVAFLVSTAIVLIYWHRRRTGLLQGWDIRSLADVIALVSQSNSSWQYEGAELLGERRQLRSLLSGNVERLGYWFTSRGLSVERWYSIGLPATQEALNRRKLSDHPHDKRYETDSVISIKLEGLSPNHLSVRERYLPWCLRNNQLVLFNVAWGIILLVLIVVSFAPGSALKNGFNPQLPSAPAPGAFSSSDFLYSFLPALLGMILFLLFQSLDLHLRILEPWGRLAHADGSLAETSLLVDYAACLPLQATWHALRNKHWRVAGISLLSTAFIFIPIFGGGVFMALTVPNSGDVRMFPNMAVFGLLLTLLILYLVGLLTLLPQRHQYRLPHAVTCLAEIISFCANDELRSEYAFRLPKNKQDLERRLGVQRRGDPEFSEKRARDRWTFGTGASRMEKLGIKKLERFTRGPKRMNGGVGGSMTVPNRDERHLAELEAWRRQKARAVGGVRDELRNSTPTLRGTSNIGVDVP